MNFRQMTVKQVQNWLRDADRQEVQNWLPDLENDDRTGVQRLVQWWYRRENRYQQQLRRWQLITRNETELRAQGYARIVGIEEAGRGPLAGPVVAAAVILPPDFIHLELNDSKQLSALQREKMAAVIRREAVNYKITYVHAEEIDRINVYQAAKKAMQQSLLGLNSEPDYLLVDAVELDVTLPQKAMIKGDARSASIAAASILAKVSRDEWMIKIADKYPAYGFDQHKGYATKEHIAALKQYGPTPIHRRSFLTRILNEQNDQRHGSGAQVRHTYK